MNESIFEMKYSKLGPFLKGQRALELLYRRQQCSHQSKVYAFIITIKQKQLKRSKEKASPLENSIAPGAHVRTIFPYHRRIMRYRICKY